MENINPIASYYKMVKLGNFHDRFTNYFNSIMISDEAQKKIDDTNKEIRKLTKELGEKNEALKQIMGDVYTSKCVKDEVPYVIKYTDRLGNAYRYAVPSGELLDELPEGAVVTTVDKKVDVVTVPIGIVYELASVVANTYRVSITANYSRANFSLLTTSLIGILNNEYTGGSIRILEKLNAKSFIKNFFNRDIDNLTLKEVREAMARNGSAEIIIKTAPLSILKKMLQESYAETAPVYKLLGFSKEGWASIEEHNLQEKAWELKSFISNKELFNKTEQEWIQMMLDEEKVVEDLTFYNIQTDAEWNCKVPGTRYEDFTKSPALGMLAWYYDKHPLFNTNYSFGKFYSYVIEESINQGYTRLRDFISILKDYLSMCASNAVKPSLFSSYLKQTHDIAARNHEIKVNQEQEEKFTEIYKDIKPVKVGEFTVLPPKNTKDIKDEGCRLNHCVASYIKRIVDGRCIIMFLRKNIEESLITVEIRDNHIVQVRGIHNRAADKAEKEALLKYADKMGLKYNA